MTVRITLEECGRERHLQQLAAGRYSVSYNDSTHLGTDEWVQLGVIDLHAAQIPLEGSSSEQFYTFTKSVSGLPKSARQGEAGEESRRVRVIEDTLALALARVGLLRPDISAELLDQLIKLDSQDGVVIVPDTNALHNGAVHWLLRVLNRPSVWLMPVVASLTTIQSRDATVKSLVNKYKIGNIVQALRSRGLVNGALGLLERNKGRCQVVEIDPSLLRYQKMASQSGSDPDQGDVLEDRLIIEAIHGVLRSMRSRTARRVVTSDVNIARILAAEGIETLFIPNISLGEQAVECLRYEALARGFVGAPVRALAWELAHAFGTIRLQRGDHYTATLECYWPGKTPFEWSVETLACEFPAIEAQSREEPTAFEQPLGQVRQPQANAQRGIEKKSAQSGPFLKKRANNRAASTPAPTPIPRATLPQMLRLLGSARRIGGGSAEAIVKAGGEPLTLDKAKRPLEVLRRVGLLEQKELIYSPTGDVESVDSALRAGDLDALSAIMERFEAYRLFYEALKERGSVRRDEVVALMHSLVGKAGIEESERLPRFHILLGQAWTNGDAIRDGSNRPTDRDATDAFQQAFAEVSSVGIAKVIDLLPRFCELSGMSPWAAKQRIEKFVASRALPDYSFQPAAGAKPVTRDEVVVGSLEKVRTDPVVIDRLYLGERPVLTVEGPAR